MTMSVPTPLIIHGAAGRMGKRLVALATEHPEKFRLVAALDRAGCPQLGQDAGTLAGVAPLGVPLTAALDSTLSVPHAAPRPVLIDFSVPVATRALLPQAIRLQLAMLIGTTGLTAADHQLLDTAAKDIPLLQATNTSLGINVLLRLVAETARQLGAEYDIEIVEAHHNQKKDAPSGTAMSLAESICQATGKNPAEALDYGRHGAEAQRMPGTIGMHAVRMGDVIGEHTVYYSATGERLELKHVASTRDTFVRGALRAAAWLATQKPGRYTMANVLGL